MSSVSVLCRLKPAADDDLNDFISVDENNTNTLVVDANKREKGQKSSEGLGNGSKTDSQNTQNLLFAFDHVVPSLSTQQEVFEVVRPVVQEALLGYNSTIFTYGQTGSGKTFTMHGGSSDSEDSRGVVPRAMEVVFDKMNEESEAGTGRIDLAISCLEIYQEKLFDLLQEENKTPGNATNNSSLRIRQRQNGEVWVEGLTDKAVTGMESFEEIFNMAVKRRAIGSHSMNSESSRSHFCCIVSIEKHTIPASEKITSKIHLIDLAGSEMVRKTSAGGARLNEAKFINKSLSALGNVINALTLGSGPGATAAHIPYRDSKLTRLLQDSLSGNAKTLLILTLSLSSCHLQESIATLRFGERARKLKTAPKINSELTDVSLKKALLRAEKQLVVLNATIAELREEVKKKDKVIETLRANGNPDHENCNHCRLMKEENEKLIAALKTAANNSSRPITSSKVKTPKSKSKSKNNSSQKTKRDVQNMTPEEIQNRFDVSRVVTVDGSDTNLKAEEESRCGVCRLNESETAMLLQDTGEELGSYFTCDGNCGNRFHVKCAGEVAEDGTYTVPSGEWYCTSCAVEDDDSVTKVHSSISPSKIPIPNDTDEEDINTPSLQNKGLKLPAGIDNEAQAQQTMARLQAEYHAMRRERNRVLNQWQHEKRLQAVSEKYREESERDRDEELITAKEVILKLQSDVLKAQRENNRLKSINDDIMLNVEKQKESEVLSPAVTGGDGEDNIQKKKEGKEKRKSNVDSELRKKITSDIMSSKPSSREKGIAKSTNSSVDKRPESIVRTSPIGVVPSPALKTVEATTSKFQIKSMPKLVRKSKKTGQIISSESGVIDGQGDSFSSPIPKPWVQRTPSETDTVIARKLSTSPIRSRKEHSNSAGAITDAGTEGSGRRGHRSRSGQSSPKTQVDSFDASAPDLSASLKSPLFNSRLKNLLASVQEEAGQYQEIRKKHKVRNDEREMLKSRSGGRGKAVPLPSIVHTTEELE